MSQPPDAPDPRQGAGDARSGPADPDSSAADARSSLNGAPAYQGIQRRLAEFLEVPLDAPEPPPGKASWTRSFRPAPAFLRYLQAMALVRMGVVLAVLLGFGAALVAATEGHPMAMVGTAVLALGMFGITVLDLMSVRFRYDTTWYVMTDRAIRNRRGIWTIRENTVSFDNVQNVKLREGPVQRYLGIQDLVVETAASSGGSGDQPAQAQSLRLEGVADGEELRSRITERMRLVQGRGLGASAPRPAGRPSTPEGGTPESATPRAATVAPGAAPAPTGAVPAPTGAVPVPFGREHVAVLHEILDEVRRLPSPHRE